MIALSRALAITKRCFITAFRDPVNISNVLYFPIIDILLIGFLGSWAQHQMEGGTSFMPAVLAGLVAWTTIYRSAMDIAFGFLTEIWDNHLLNLFSTPITLLEIILGSSVISIVQGCFIFFYCAGLLWLIYGINFFTYGFALIPHIGLFIACGWFLGLLCLPVLLYFGKITVTFMWSLPWLFAALSGAYAPTTLFPVWLQHISATFPTTYAFEAMRGLVMHGTTSYHTLAIGYALAALYCVICYGVVSWVFGLSKNRGLARLE